MVSLNIQVGHSAIDLKEDSLGVTEKKYYVLRITVPTEWFF